MFIKSICLSNFKGFIGDNHQINFKIPDGTTAGSGLNIFVGENNSGKSSIFEAVDFLRNGIKGEIDRIISKSEDNTEDVQACIELTFLVIFKTQLITLFSLINKPFLPVQSQEIMSLEQEEVH